MRVLVDSKLGVTLVTESAEDREVIRRFERGGIKINAVVLVPDGTFSEMQLTFADLNKLAARYRQGIISYVGAPLSAPLPRPDLPAAEPDIPSQVQALAQRWGVPYLPAPPPQKILQEWLALARENLTEGLPDD